MLYFHSEMVVVAKSGELHHLSDDARLEDAVTQCFNEQRACAPPFMNSACNLTWASWLLTALASVCSQTHAVRHRPTAWRG